MANYTLEMTFPKPPGVAGTGLDSNHAVYKAYTGIPYRFFCGFVGGKGPYTFSISGQPSGMVIDENTGEVTWSNPTAGTHEDITVTVTDAEDSSDSETFDLTVGTSGFLFVNAAAAGGGDGSFGSPYNSITQLYANTSAATAVAYFYSGTYTIASGDVTAGGDQQHRRIMFAQSSGRCTSWRVVPGETVTIDFQSDHDHSDTGAPAIGMSGDRIYFDGFHLLDGYNKFLHFDRNAGRGMYVINCQFENLGPGLASSNAACVMFSHQLSAHPYNDCVVNCTVENIGYGDGEICMIKAYDSIKPYFGFLTGSVDLESSETLALKAAVNQWMCYRCDIATDFVAQGGDMNSDTATCSGDFSFCRFKGSGTVPDSWAVQFNQFSNAAGIYYDRCTIEGSIFARKVDSNDGPFNFTNCVIVNGDSGQSPVAFAWAEGGAASGDYTGTYDASRVSLAGSLTPTGTQNLRGSAAQISLTAQGYLQGSQRTSYFPGWGHELDEDETPAVVTPRRYRTMRVKAA